MKLKQFASAVLGVIYGAVVASTVWQAAVFHYGNGSEWALFIVVILLAVAIAITIFGNLDWEDK